MIPIDDTKKRVSVKPQSAAEVSATAKTGTSSTSRRSQATLLAGAVKRKRYVEIQARCFTEVDRNSEWQTVTLVVKFRLSGIFSYLPPLGPWFESHRGRYVDWVSVPT